MCSNLLDTCSINVSIAAEPVSGHSFSLATSLTTVHSAVKPVTVHFVSATLSPIITSSISSAASPRSAPGPVSVHSSLSAAGPNMAYSVPVSFTASSATVYSFSLTAGPVSAHSTLSAAEPVSVHPVLPTASPDVVCSVPFAVRLVSAHSFLHSVLSVESPLTAHSMSSAESLITVSSITSSALSTDLSMLSLAPSTFISAHYILSTATAGTSPTPPVSVTCLSALSLGTPTATSTPSADHETLSDVSASVADVSSPGFTTVVSNPISSIKAGTNVKVQESEQAEDDHTCSVCSKHSAPSAINILWRHINTDHISRHCFPPAGFFAKHSRLICSISTCRWASHFRFQQSGCQRRLSAGSCCRGALIEASEVDLIPAVLHSVKPDVFPQGDGLDTSLISPDANDESHSHSELLSIAVVAIDKLHLSDQYHSVESQLVNTIMNSI